MRLYKLNYHYKEQNMFREESARLNNLEERIAKLRGSL